MPIKTIILTLCFFFSTSGYSKIKIGTLIYLPPFVVSLAAGIDIDLSRSLCARLHEECQFIPLRVEQLYDAISTGEVDIAIGGIPIHTNNRMFIFSLPYMLSRGQFLMTKGRQIHSIGDLKGSLVGVIRDDLNGGLFYNYLFNQYPGQFKMKQFNDIEDILAALSDKTISAAFLSHPVVNYWKQNSVNQFTSLGSPISIGEGIAIMSLSKNKKLIQRINQQLQIMQKDNTMTQLYNTYLFNE